MLTKIIKHEFKATYRTFIPIYIALAIVTGAACLFLPALSKYNNSILSIVMGFGIILLVLGFIFVIMSPYIFLSVRFYKTTATREAYLTFTIPTDTKIILLGKFIVTFIWTTVTILLWLLAFIALSYRFDFGLSFSFDSNIVLQILYLAASISCSILTIFAAISLSQLVRDHRVIASFAFYMALTTVQQIVSIAALIPIMLKELSASGDAEYTASGTVTSDTTVYVLSLIIGIVFSLVFYFISNYMLKKKLNLYLIRPLFIVPGRIGPNRDQHRYLDEISRHQPSV